MLTVYIACIILALISGFLIAQVLNAWQKRQVEKIEKGVEWDLEKMKKIAKGWRPPYWDGDVAAGKLLPFKQRPQVPGGKR